MAKQNLTKEQKQELRQSFFPFYKGEDIFSAVAHIVGAVFALVALVLMIVKASPNPVAVVAVSIYGVCMLLLFTMSAIYHFLRRNKGKKVLRVLDQCSIFLLIAGTYTPFGLLAFPNATTGYWLIGAVWAISILGITLNAINMRNKAVMIFSQIAYIVLGWCVVFAINPLIQVLQIGGVIWLVLGGLLYTGGIVFFAFGRRVPYFHPIWHMFVVLGAVAQFVSVYVYVL